MIRKPKFMRRRVVCVDFDGVIYNNIKYQGTTVLNGLPVPGVAAALMELSKSSRVIINSSRFEADEGVEAARAWLIKYDMQYELSKHKPTADVYIDDRAVCFTGDWTETLKEVAGFRQWQADTKLMNKFNNGNTNRKTRLWKR